MTTNIMAQLETLSSEQWQNLFDSAIKAGAQEVKQNGDILYRYLGELDDPSEAYSSFATAKDVNSSWDKDNWFIGSNGKFFRCSDYAAESIFDSGKCVEDLFPFEEKRFNLYDSLSKEQRISFRIKYQGMDEQEAKEMVCNELGIPAYQFTFTYAIVETHLDDSTMKTEEHSFNECVEADSKEEAEQKLNTGLRKINSVVQSGTRYSKEDNRKIRESGNLSIGLFGYAGIGTPYTITVKDRTVTFIKQEKNN